MSEADWDQVVDTNLKGAWLMAQEVARHMVRLGHGGAIVNVASILGLGGSPGVAAYCASKAGVVNLTRALAVELARHDIQVNAVVPGWIETDMTEGARSWDKLNQAVLARTPARRWGTPEDFEAVAVYLASTGSRFHTGDVLRLDGGYSLF